MTGRDERLGLALSGGGFRATLFHLGVVRCLHDTGLLARVTRIGAVSGGSIMAAHLALHWGRYTGSNAEFEDAADDLIAFITTDVRGRVVRRWILAWLLLFPRLFRPRRWTFTNLLQRRYAALFKNATLSDLQAETTPRAPRVDLYCTSLSTGSACTFNSRGFFWEGTEHGIAAPSTPLAFAVAASSAFPPLFPPITISHRILSCDIKEFPNPQYLTDGGVFDNLGIDQMLGRSDGFSDFEYCLVSDAEGNFDWDFSTSYTFITTRNIRASDLLMKRVSTLEYQRLHTYREKLILCDIDTVIDNGPQTGALAPEIQRAIRNVRTDLDAFSADEINWLVRHGYTVTLTRLLEKKLASIADSGWQPPRGYTAPTRLNLRRVLQSRQRSLGLWSVRDPVSWLSVVVFACWVLLGLTPFYLQRAQLTGQLAEATTQLSEARSFAARLTLEPDERLLAGSQSKATPAEYLSAASDMRARLVEARANGLLPDTGPLGIAFADYEAALKRLQANYENGMSPVDRETPIEDQDGDTFRNAATDLARALNVIQPEQCKALVLVRKLGWTNGNEAEFCRARGFDGVHNVASKYHVGGYCFRGPPDVCLAEIQKYLYSD